MFGLFKKESPPPISDPLDQPLLFFSESDALTIRDACEGVQVFGGIGSGKTSGSGSHLARAFLSSGFGGLVLTAKADETALWKTYAEQTGRTDDLLIVGPAHAETFNILRYECEHGGPGAGVTENLVGLFDTLSQVANGNNGSGGRENEAFWRNETKKMIRNAIDVLRFGREAITFTNIHQVIISAPRSIQIRDADGAEEKSYCLKVLRVATLAYNNGKFGPAKDPEYLLVFNYWAEEFPQMDERPRSTVISSFTGMADVFLRGILRQLFSAETTFTPEDSFAGKIIVLDLPQKIFNEVGVYAQVLFKYCWQRSVERRRVQMDSRPVFLWADESQHFVNEHDVTFQTTARSSRVCTIYLTQNLPNYRFVLGGTQRGDALVDSLLGNLATKIFHNNTCAQTNAYAAELFSKDWRDSDTHSYSQDAGQTKLSGSTTQQLEHVVPPVTFTTLAKGGPENNYAVEAIIHQGGKTFDLSGINALRTVFFQNHQT